MEGHKTQGGRLIEQESIRSNTVGLKREGMGRGVKGRRMEGKMRREARQGKEKVGKDEKKREMEGKGRGGEVKRKKMWTTREVEYRKIGEWNRQGR